MNGCKNMVKRREKRGWGGKGVRNGGLVFFQIKTACCAAVIYLNSLLELCSMVIDEWDEYHM